MEVRQGFTGFLGTTDGMYVGYLSPHNTLTSLDDDAEVFIWLSKIEYRIEQAFKTTYYI